MGVNGVATIDGSAAGRGAWLCGPQCLTAALARRGFDRAWRAAAPGTVGDDLRAAFAALDSGLEVDDLNERMGADHCESAAHETMLMRAKG
jgi:predicted RNA-binding protein YlxR (DUF448 family)